MKRDESGKFLRSADSKGDPISCRLRLQDRREFVAAAEEMGLKPGQLLEHVVMEWLDDYRGRAGL